VGRIQKHKYYLAGAASLITIAVYLACLHNEFLNWDDNLYIVENPYIRSINLFFFKWAFLDFYASNWHPLTWMSHAFDYAVWGLNPLGHHVTNIVIHAVNTFVVVLLIIRLLDALKERTGEKGIQIFSMSELCSNSGVTGLCSIHPLHVESVAWVSERKDLLALFYLLSIASYVKYGKDEDDKPAHKKHLPFYIKYIIFHRLAFSRLLC
jgi:hypothetical protein